MELTFLYCEGSHDLAFISKIITSHFLTESEIKKVEKLPKVLRDLVKSSIDKVNTDELRIDKPLSVFLPNKVYEISPKKFICMFTMGGKNNLKASIENIEKASLLMKASRISSEPITNIRHLFILDADYKGIENGGLESTLSQLASKLQKPVSNENFMFDTSPQFVKTLHGDVGVFVITDDQGEEGTLEDLLELVLKPEQLREHAESYKAKIIEFDKQNNQKPKDKTKLQKVLFTSISQAFYPGSSLAVGLSEELLVDADKLKDLDVTKDLIRFLSQ